MDIFCGMHPVVKAAVENDVTTLRKLFENKKSINEFKYMRPDFCLNVAVGRNNLEMVNLIVSKTKINLNNENSSMNPLATAIYCGRIEMTKLLLDLGAHIEKSWFCNKTMPPLLMAARCFNSDIVTLLLDRGANIHATDESHQSVLHKVADNCRYKENKGKTDAEEEIKKEKENQLCVATLLLEKGADVNARDNDGKTPLDYAIAGRNSDLCKLFIINGAELKKPKQKGGVIEHYGYLSDPVIYQSSELTRLCLERGSNFVPLHDETETNYLTPYESALHFGCIETLKVFWQFGCPYDPPLERSTKLESQSEEHRKIIQNILAVQDKFINGIKTNSLDMVITAIEEGAEPKGCSIDVPSTLHFVAKKGYFELAELLLEQGVPVNQINERETPLFVAVKMRNYQMCTVLLRFGACYNQRIVSDLLKERAKEKEYEDIRNLFKDIHKVFKFVKKGNMKVIQLLNGYTLSYRKKMIFVLMNCVNRRGLTMAGTALMMGHLELAQKLMEVRINAM